MNKSIEGQRKNYQAQLDQATQQIGQYEQALAMLRNKVEQLKGALFALQALEQELSKDSETKAEEVKVEGQEAKSEDATEAKA